MGAKAILTPVSTEFNVKREVTYMNYAQDEERKNIFWKVLIAVSSVLLIVIAAYFVFQLFTANPLEGTWVYEDGDLRMTIKDGQTAEFVLEEYAEKGMMTITMYYKVDVDQKTLSLYLSDEEAARISENTNGEVSVEEVRLIFDSLEGSYDYNIEQNQLTLTEREYGEQMIFDKQ